MTKKAPKKVKAHGKAPTEAPSSAELSEDQLEQIAGGVVSDGSQSVVSEKVGPDHVIHRHLAGVKY